MGKHVMQLRTNKGAGKGKSHLELEEMRREFLRPLGFCRRPFERKVRCWSANPVAPSSVPIRADASQVSDAAINARMSEKSADPDPLVAPSVEPGSVQVEKQPAGR